MRRREFIASLGGAVVWPLAARAQDKRMPTVGVLIVANREPFWTLFKKGLSEFGYVEGRNIRFEFRSAEGRFGELPALAAELVRLRVDAIVAVQSPCVHAAMRATSDIPIIMAPAADPLGAGFVASLNHPGGNVTGLSFVTPDLMGKNLELLREIVPSLRRVAFLGVSGDPVTSTFTQQVEHAGRTLQIETRSIIMKGMDELEAAFAQLASERIDAVILQPNLPRKPAASLALKYRLPALSPNRGFPEEGGLLSYAGSLEQVYLRVGAYLDRVLKGAKPALLPVEQPTKFELVINLKTAKALGLTVPPTLLARADEVIE